ncbi:hypothetical protein [Streptomyces uncialis]|uniref:Uncharacterized protein n=1 Tax=Streptomyces uncialis TaxID=1048205 RepID=A0A1Q4V0Y8_9ACTN|nr:hypothetical protein [Streptomyces uncialis]OKH91466.1 hypothetical protein AB852_28310 [Streptomyces uncialis]
MTTPESLTPEAVSAILRDPSSPLYPTQITVYCDECGTEFTADYMVTTDQTSSERLEAARAHMRTQGWQCDRTGDHCPQDKAAPNPQPADCARCQQPFDSTDTRFDGRAQHRDTQWCRRCTDNCHDTTDAFHICAICR